MPLCAPFFRKWYIREFAIGDWSRTSTVWRARIPPAEGSPVQPLNCDLTSHLTAWWLFPSVDFAPAMASNPTFGSYVNGVLVGREGYLGMRACQFCFPAPWAISPRACLIFNDFYYNNKRNAYHNGQIPHRSMPSSITMWAVRRTGFHCQRPRQRFH